MFEYQKIFQRKNIIVSIDLFKAQYFDYYNWNWKTSFCKKSLGKSFKIVYVVDQVRVETKVIEFKNLNNYENCSNIEY